MNYGRTYNFSAGPAMMPEAVLEDLIRIRREGLRLLQEAGHGDPEQRNLRQREILIQEEYLRRFREDAGSLSEETTPGEIPPDSTAQGNPPSTSGAKQGKLPSTSGTAQEKPPSTSGKAAMDAVRRAFSEETKARETMGAETGRQFDNAFRYLEEAVGQGQELVLFVTEITAGYDTSWFVEQFGCDAYFRHNRELLFDRRQEQIRDRILAARSGERTE